MRSTYAAVLLLCCLISLVAAWSKEDHEIFRLRDEVAQHEGENATFYSFIGVKPSASLDEINKAYRKRSRIIHPDKARQSFIANYDRADVKPTTTPKPGKKPGVHVHKHKQPSQREITAFTKEATARFQRLGIVANVLRGPERDRYDHFLRNGFPKWRGTGYYYERFRPGLGTVLLGLFAFVGGGAHYLALWLGWKRQRDFVDRYIRHARRMAWGDETGIQGIAGLGTNGTATPPVQPDSQAEEPAMQWNRKQKRMQERENRRASKNPKAAKAAEKARTSGISTPQEVELTSGPVGAKKRTVAENGKVLIVDSAGNVYLEEETEEGDVHEFLLDVDEIPKPTVYDTVLFRLPLWAWNRTVGKAMNKRTLDAEVAENVGEEEREEDADAALQAATATNQNGETRKRRLNRAK
ncbi:hypothetical protein H2203_003968 [Taxawa tesnikishii (nom. ined.)]|nr:hypothetical protein H2203_003968 [Dothideales sp. JES 119]